MIRRIIFPWIKKLTAALGIPVVEKAGIEADDILASAAVKLAAEGNDVFMVSADKDLAQIIRPGIKQLLPPPTANPRLGWRELDAEGVFNKFGVKVDQVVDYLALIGDTADNIPGLQGVGPKTAVKWITEYGSIDGIVKNANYIAPARFQVVIPKNAELLKTNVEMIRLRTDLEEGRSLPEAKRDAEGLIEMLESMEMKTTANEARKRYLAG